MRLFTIQKDQREYVAVETKERELVTLESLGISVRDMNDLITRYEELKDLILDKLLNNSKQNSEQNIDQNCEQDIDQNCEQNSMLALKQDEYKILAPIPVPMQDVICLGVNYKSHIEETVDVLDFTKKKDAVYFAKRVNRANDPGGVIPYYDFVDSLDYEVELGVVLAKDAFRVSIEEAADYILGYTIINDVSARNLQKRHQQWYLGKSLDGYTPMGPCIVTADEIGNAHDLTIECYVNGEKRQSSNTSLMITSAEEAISELSQGMTLKAGTIIATGTPGGVGMGMNPPVFLKKGDIIRCEIAGIGILENAVENN